MSHIHNQRYLLPHRELRIKGNTLKVEDISPFWIGQTVTIRFLENTKINGFADLFINDSTLTTTYFKVDIVCR